MALTVDQLIEEKNGQYSFFDSCYEIEKENEIEDSFFKVILCFRKEILELLKVKEEYPNHEKLLNTSVLEAYKQMTKPKFDSFIKRYLEWFDSYPYKEILEKYEDSYSTDYHNVGKVFLIYLHFFVYEESIVNCLNQELCLRMEKFIEVDHLPYKGKYAYIKNVEMAKRKKLRVDGYIVYRIKPFLQKMEKIASQVSKVSSEYEKIMQNMITKEQIRGLIQVEMQNIIGDESLHNAIFEQGSKYVEEKNQEVLAMLFLKYLEICVYDNTEAYQNENLLKFIFKIEDYVIFHLENSFSLSQNQEKTYLYAKEQVAKRISKYVNKEGNSLVEVLKDYDKLVVFKEGHQLKMIEEEENVEDFPNTYSEEEIKQKLEVFLETIFRLSKNLDKDKLPIFTEGLEKERNVSCTIALEYLYRFVYKVSKDYFLEKESLANLENYIASCEDFKVSCSNLCLAKSILLDRVNRRNVLATPYTKSLIQKTLQSRTN